MDRPRTRDEVRRLVARELRRDVHKLCWEQMIERGLVDDVIYDPDWQEVLRYLLKQYRACEEFVRQVLRDGLVREKSEREIKAKPSGDRRWEALSLLFKRKAGMQKGIRSFWKAIRAPLSNPSEWLDKVTSGTDRVIEALVKSQVRAQLVEEESFRDEEEAVKYFDELVEAVKDRYGLDSFEAHLFLLEGVWPKEVPPGRARIKYHPQFPCLDRLVLEVDPCLREEDALRLYRQVRQMYWREFYREKSRAGRVSDKGYELVRFVLEEGEGLTWGQRLEKWNERYPDGHPWHYTYDTNMARDFHRLIRRIVGMSYKRFMQPNVVRPVPLEEP